MSAKGRIVVVEDESPIRRGVCDALRLTGYDVVETADGVAGLTAALQPGIDLVLLDLLLPKIEGLMVLGEIRKKSPTLPVIVLTARGSEDDRVKGLERGADDYVVKPFSARELLARVEAVLRRTSKRPTPIKNIALGRGIIDLHRREIRWPDGERCELSETETNLLQFLLEHRDRAVSREELLSRIWGIHGGIETRTIDMHIVRLRAKLRDPAGHDSPEAIVTVRAMGYMAGPDLIVREES